MKDQARVAHTIRNHYRYVILEGWTQVVHRLFRTDEKFGYVFALEYSAEDGNNGGEFWVVPDQQLDSILDIITEYDIPPKLE